ncbi:apolipoprotein A-I-like isoform X2 [Notolabrus celidotus]|nr:apolipoprotein A-I-like isoform X2 [Notolabrus celidotus]
MKFVTLALALLLAVGSQAVPLQADAPAPSMLEHARGVLDLYMTQGKQSLLNAINQIEDVPARTRMTETVESAFVKIKAAQGVVAPMTDTVVGGVMAATDEFRQRVNTDVEALKTELVPLRENLRTVVEKHIAEYKAAYLPVLQEYMDKHPTEFADLKTKLEDIMGQMQEKVKANVEETKSAMIPIVETVRGKVSGWLLQVKEMADPYVQEYREKLRETATQVQNVTPEEIADLNKRLEPLAKEASEKVQTMAMEIYNTFNKA